MVKSHMEIASKLTISWVLSIFTTFVGSMTYIQIFAILLSIIYTIMCIYFLIKKFKMQLEAEKRILKLEKDYILAKTNMEREDIIKKTKMNIEFIENIEE